MTVYYGLVKCVPSVYNRTMYNWIYKIVCLVLKKDFKGKSVHEIYSSRLLQKLAK